MLNNEIDKKKKSMRKGEKKLESTRQTHGLSHKTEITS
jgi:hypothetical protein